jgi:hypothetical protein
MECDTTATSFQVVGRQKDRWPGKPRKRSCSSRSYLYYDGSALDGNFRYESRKGDTVQ